jgi:hypothetical protein
MNCDTFAKLKNEYDEAEAAFELKRTQLQSRMGTSQEHQYDRLNTECEAAWKALQEARSHLDLHIREHGCNAMASVSGLCEHMFRKSAIWEAIASMSIALRC